MELIKRRVILCFSLSPPVGPVGGLTIAEVDHVHLTLHSGYGLTERTVYTCMSGHVFGHVTGHVTDQVTDQVTGRSCDWSCDWSCD